MDFIPIDRDILNAVTKVSSGTDYEWAMWWDLLAREPETFRHNGGKDYNLKIPRIPPSSNIRTGALDTNGKPLTQSQLLRTDWDVFKCRWVQPAKATKKKLVHKRRISKASLIPIAKRVCSEKPNFHVQSFPITEAVSGNDVTDTVTETAVNDVDTEIESTAGEEGDGNCSVTETDYDSETIDEILSDENDHRFEPRERETLQCLRRVCVIASEKQGANAKLREEVAELRLQLADAKKEAAKARKALDNVKQFVYAEVDAARSSLIA